MGFIVDVIEAIGWRNSWSGIFQNSDRNFVVCAPEATISIRAYLPDPGELLYTYPPEKGGRCRRW